MMVSPVALPLRLQFPYDCEIMLFLQFYDVTIIPFWKFESREKGSFSPPLSRKIGFESTLVKLKIKIAPMRSYLLSMLIFFHLLTS